MAKSKTGGSRAYIRGRIGSDVYSVGKDGKGKRQQVVRSLAEQVSNPRTSSQMFGRMVMSTVMQAVSALQPIIDHSFDGIAKGQPSISEFIRRNYALVKADAVAHPASGNVFLLSEYQEKGVQLGKYVISAGSAVLPAALHFDQGSPTISLTAQTMTVGGLKAALGLTADGYFTCVFVNDLGAAYFFRVKLSTSLADDTAITSANVNSLFSYEGNITPTALVSDNDIYFSAAFDGNNFASGIIVSDMSNGAWIHNDCTLEGTWPASKAADVVLPTYPTGTAQFLNGGDL